MLEYQEIMVETDRLRIFGNILEWEKMAIQITSISEISEEAMEPYPFPNVSGIAICAGCFSLFLNRLTGIVLIVFGLIILCTWYGINKKRIEKNILVIKMNSGDRIMIPFANRIFLQTTMEVLKVFMKEQVKPYAEYIFDLKNNKICGNADILTILNVSC